MERQLQRCWLDNWSTIDVSSLISNDPGSAGPTTIGNKTGYTATEVACRWAVAVIQKANPSIWAGAVTQKPPVTPKKLTWMDWRTDGPTDRPTDIAGSRVACTRLKSLATFTVDSVFSPHVLKSHVSDCFWLFLVFMLTRTKEKNNRPCNLGTASLVCLSQLKGLQMKIVDFGHFDCQIPR